MQTCMGGGGAMLWESLTLHQGPLTLSDTTWCEAGQHFMPCLWPISLVLFTRLLSEYWQFVTQSLSRVSDVSRQAGWIALRQSFVLFVSLFFFFLITGFCAHHTFGQTWFYLVWHLCGLRVTHTEAQAHTHTHTHTRWTDLNSLFIPLLLLSLPTHHAGL